MAEQKKPVFLAFKEGSFYDEKSKDTISFYQCALDFGNYLKIYSVKSQQIDSFRNYVPGEVISDYVIAGKYIVLI